MNRRWFEKEFENLGRALGFLGVRYGVRHHGQYHDRQLGQVQSTEGRGKDKLVPDGELDVLQ